MQKPNSQMQAILDAHKAMGPLPIEEQTVENARLIPLLDRAAVAVYGQHFTKRALAPMPRSVAKVEHRTIPKLNSDDGEILLRIYTPKGNVPTTGWPVAVYYHGGGWVIANLDTYDSSCRAICDNAKCVVVSVGYAQAPEHKWPAAPNDAYAAYKWVLENTVLIGGDLMSVAVAGESAGGNLAAVVTLMARDNQLPPPVHQLLIYPVTDLENGFNSPSARENVNAAPLNTAMLDWFYSHYLPEGEDRKQAYISPLYANLSDLPTATIILAEIDPLRSDGEQYAAKLGHEGVQVNLKKFAGVTHEFFGLDGLVTEATDAVKFAAENLHYAFTHHDSRSVA